MATKNRSGAGTRTALVDDVFELDLAGRSPLVSSPGSNSAPENEASAGIKSQHLPRDGRSPAFRFLAGSIKPNLSARQLTGLQNPWTAGDFGFLEPRGHENDFCLGIRGKASQRLAEMFQGCSGARAIRVGK